MKLLPYFRWYPADAETDADFKAMDDADIGFYMRCLNHAWINGSIPSDPKERARVLRTRIDIAQKRWQRVGKVFVTSMEHGGNFVNPRQERERVHALAKSVKASESVKVRYGRSYERSTDELPRALARAVSVSVSPVKSLDFTGANPKKPNKAGLDAQFHAIAEHWKQLARPDQAAQMWLSVVTPENLASVLACIARYRESQQWKEGIVQELCKFLQEQHDAGWNGKWPAAVNGNHAVRKLTPLEELNEKWKKDHAKP